MIIIVMFIGAYAMYMLLRILYAKKWNKNLTANVKFSVDHIVRGETLELVEIVTNRKKLPLAYINLKFTVDKSIYFSDGSDNWCITAKSYRNDIFSLMMYQKVTRRIPVKCSKRGVYIIDKLELVSNGLFMNDVYVMGVEQHTEITVYPNASDVNDIEVLYAKVMGSVERNRQFNPDPFAFRQIREYDTSDPMNLINWKASAKTGQLMVNQYNETASPSVCILLNLESEGMLRYDVISEQSISIAAGLAQMLLEQGIHVSMLCNARGYGDKDITKVELGVGFAHLNVINTALARISLDSEITDFCTLLDDYSNHFTRSIFLGNDAKSTLYIMISQNSRQNLQQCFDKLSGRDSLSMWILPYFKGMEAKLSYTQAECIMWEVMHNAEG